MISNVLSSSYLLDTPYFFDKELDICCLIKLAGCISDLCNTKNCVKIDENFVQKRNQVVIICFLGDTNRQYTYFSKGKSTIIYREYSKELNDYSYKKIVKEIAEKIRSECRMSVFDIYFTVDLSSLNDTFFYKDRLHIGVDLIKECFKQEMKTEAVVKYFPNNYTTYLKRSISPLNLFKKVQVQKFKANEDENLIFFDDLFLDNMLNEIEDHIRDYEQDNISDLKKKFKSEN